MSEESHLTKLAVAQAATCGRCRSELGEAGRVCRHCRMDDVWVGWEARLFRLESRAMGAGDYVSHEDALRQVSLEAFWTLTVHLLGRYVIC